MRLDEKCGDFTGSRAAVLPSVICRGRPTCHSIHAGTAANVSHE
jgi:hypothetical protein